MSIYIINLVSVSYYELHDIQFIPKGQTFIQTFHVKSSGYGVIGHLSFQIKGKTEEIVTENLSYLIYSKSY
jgi:hypothetical protein